MCPISKIYLTNLHKSASLLHVQVQPVQVERLLRNRRASRHRFPYLVHVAEQLVEEEPALGILVHLVELREAVGFLCERQANR